MGFCGKHNDVECRFFCNTCSIPVCHFCLEKGDHMISEHDCIPIKEYCKRKSNEILTVLEEANKQKLRYDKIKSKWDMHLSSIVAEFDQIKNEILLTKQHLLQQLDLQEQSQLKAAGIEKAKTETAIKIIQCSHEQSFSGVYQQLNEKCQFLLRNLSLQNSSDKEECRNLLNSLQQVLGKYEKENLLGINLTFVPSKVCLLGKVVVARDSGLTEFTLESFNTEVSGEPTKKRMRTASDTVAVSIKQEKVDPSESVLNPSSNCIFNASTLNVNALNANRSSHDVSFSSILKTCAEQSNRDGRIMNTTKTDPAQSNQDGGIKSTIKADTKQTNHHVNLLSIDCRPQSAGTSRSLIARPPVPKSLNENQINSPQKHITVGSCCSGIVWADEDWLLEVSTTKACIKVKHHKISGCSQSFPDTIINCSQNMENVELRVCPKINPPDFSFVVAFKDQIAIISLQEKKVRKITWKRIPNTFAILAISWGKDPSNYVAIVRRPDGTVSLMRDVTKSPGTCELEIRSLSNIDSGDYHPLDISSNDQFAVCNTLSGRILFFSSLGKLSPTKQVLGPSSLTDGKPLSVSVLDNKKEWLALWKGRSSSDGQPKWAIVHYNASFITLSTIIQCSYKKLHEEPETFCVRRNKIAVLYNSLNIDFHTGLQTLS